MYKIIVNADDFGRHERINDAVQIGIEKGCLRSATIMPGGIAFDHAISLAKSHRQLGLGIHFTLVNGNPILPPDEIPSIVDENGKFHNDYGKFVKLYMQRKVMFDDVQRELAAQLKKVLSTGVNLTHCDSHQHIHVLPGITEIIFDLAMSAGIRAIRIPATGLFLGGSIGDDKLGSIVGRAGLRCMAERARKKASRCGMISSDYFAGNVAGRAVNEQDFCRIISKLKHGVTEIMMHPGTNNSILQKDCLWEHDFEAELASVSIAPNYELFSEKKVRLINFGDIL